MHYILVLLIVVSLYQVALRGYMPFLKKNLKSKSRPPNQITLNTSSAVSSINLESIVYVVIFATYLRDTLTGRSFLPWFLQIGKNKCTSTSRIIL